jgi:RHS repeat-associated protein
MDELTNNQVTRSYAYGHSLISQRQIANGQWLTSFYGYDGQGNVRFLTDFSGAITDHYTYDAFGNLIATTGNTPNEHLFAGEQYDSNVGLYYLRARYLDPQSGRFLSMDPAKGSNSDPRSLHKYLYSLNDPVNRIDPSGLMRIGEMAATTATIGILAASVGGMVFNTYKTLHNLPPNPFRGYPDAALIGYEGQLNASYVFGKALGPYGAVATALISGLGGVDVLIPFSSPQLWVYGYLGLGLGLEVDDLTRAGSLSLHVGLIWNAKNSGMYAGPFFCTSIATSSVNVGQWGFPTFAPSLCSSKDPNTGIPQAYGFQVKVVETGSNSLGVSTSYTNFSEATEITPDNVISVAPSYDSIVSLARQLIVPH